MTVYRQNILTKLIRYWRQMDDYDRRKSAYRDAATADLIRYLDVIHDDVFRQKAMAALSDRSAFDTLQREFSEAQGKNIPAR